MISVNSVHAFCISLVEGKIIELNALLHEMMEAASGESKSSAGDKHETARAMMQLEQEKIGRQLLDINVQMEVLAKMHHLESHSQVLQGSLVKTDKAVFYLSVAIGKIIVEGQAVMVLSPQSPLGQALLGKKEGERFSLNGNAYLIESVT